MQMVGLGVRQIAREKRKTNTVSGRLVAIQSKNTNLPVKPSPP
jgi:hypothetical protein